MSEKIILVTGANGYVGSRLAQTLMDKGYKVRCMSRHLHEGDIDRIPRAQWVKADAFKPNTLEDALKGIDTAYYLIHSMGSNQEFSVLDREAAQNFARAASHNRVRRIIYLGGLGLGTDNLSPHLKSRQEVGALLRAASCEVIELRASIIIGPGSISFELVRSLVERLPIMVTPKWVSIKTQPIYIDDVVAYLIEALSVAFDKNEIFEIGGSEVLSYSDLMKAYAKLRELKRLMIPVPVLTPYLSSLWLGLVTPLYARIGRKLIASLSNQTIVHDHRAEGSFNVIPTPIHEALKKADEEEKQNYLRVHWYDVDSTVSHAKLYHDVINYGRRLYHIEKAHTKASRSTIFKVISEIGGEHGFYYANLLWRMRATLDKMVGGVGNRKGRRYVSNLRVGDTIGFWRVQKIVRNELLILYAEMRLPGRAWLQFELLDKDNELIVYQTAIFDPKGLWGIVYWYSLSPFHYFLFKGMLNAIIKHAETLHQV